MVSTVRRLSEMTDEGAFERFATDVLRWALGNWPAGMHFFLDLWPAVYNYRNGGRGRASQDCGPVDLGWLPAKLDSNHIAGQRLGAGEQETPPLEGRRWSC
jgi:hypothetical protein